MLSEAELPLRKLKEVEATLFGAVSVEAKEILRLGSSSLAKKNRRSG
jgi:hypothetical protein